MNLKSILKFDNSKIIAPEYIIFISIDKKDEEITLTKYVFNNRDVLRFINYFKEKTDENDCVALKDRKRIKKYLSKKLFTTVLDTKFEGIKSKEYCDLYMTLIYKESFDIKIKKVIQLLDILDNHYFGLNKF